jgi:RecA-family ATPase
MSNRTPQQVAEEAIAQHLKPLQWLDMSTWDDEPRPEREWSIFNRVPLKQAGLFSGEGGAGKSIIEMSKDAAHVTGNDWLGSLPVVGPAWYIGAEDDEKEIHIRFYDIARHYGVTFKELISGGLKVLCLLGQDATLCHIAGKSGRVETTKLYRQLYEEAGDVKPKNISIDTLSRAFAGSEIDRVQVYAFAMHMQALRKTNTAPRVKPSCFAISAACSSPKAEFPTSTNWRKNKKLMKSSLHYSGDSRRQAAT